MRPMARSASPTGLTWRSFNATALWLRRKQRKKTRAQLARLSRPRCRRTRFFPRTISPVQALLISYYLTIFSANGTDVLSKDDALGGWRRASPEKIVMDYGGPNVAKPLHVGHLRSAIIGESLKRLFRFVGDEVIADIHLGDWGLQMGQLISELELRAPELPYFKEGAQSPFPAEPPINLSDLEDMYPKASAACKADAARAATARTATKALQDGRPGYRALWRHFVDLSVAAMRSNYDHLGVHFDLWKGEADADALIPEMIKNLKSKGLVETSDGAEIIRVERHDDNKDVPPVMLVNSRGAVGYHATDIATILDRKRSLDPAGIVYVVDNRQALHFEQVFRAAAAAGYFAEARARTSRLRHHARQGRQTVQNPRRRCPEIARSDRYGRGPRRCAARRERSRRRLKPPKKQTPSRARSVSPRLNSRTCPISGPRIIFSTSIASQRLRARPDLISSMPACGCARCCAKPARPAG